ncbi:hypothetical protein [Streptomyces katsurahamanus]|uniref:Uncharacterized protein n=1 Tax=Streptomyces katsurahamanus TaxID=2577098 RepID=A0ABW9NPW5_9ACTN|nr:hypothetical protein [Streptomyces katsurahamanus]MQS35119.1 hypothetical protein [Streptomyces katsurahamanus]
MEFGTATQLITVGATLSGVVLTLLANASLERRKARDTRELESMRLDSEHSAWLREERTKAYASLSLAGEEVLQFIRSEMPLLIGSDGAARRADAEARWRELRTELRKAYNQVALFGADQARTAGLHMWRTARSGGNDFLRGLGPDGVAPSEQLDLSEQIRTIASDLGTADDRFLEACRKDLQGG